MVRIDSDWNKRRSIRGKSNRPRSELIGIYIFKRTVHLRVHLPDFYYPGWIDRSDDEYDLSYSRDA